jgi:serine/threonine protein kinase
MDADSSLLPGDPATIGSYRIIGRLGSGGMGVVYLALSRGGRRVALKVVRRELAEDEAFRQRFENEVRAATQVHSAYTAAVIDADPTGSPPWLATSFVNGPSLSRQVQETGPMPASEVWALGAGVAEALTAIHDSGIVHRDLKPSNVLLADDGPRVIDFGIARAAQAASITQTGLMVGSPAYMAPEYVAGQGSGPEGDVFALAGTVLFAATGRPPFGEGPAEAVMMRLLHEQARLEGVDDRLARVLTRALDKDPAKRPDARSLIAVFADGAEERGATMSFPRRPASASSRPTYQPPPTYEPSPTYQPPTYEPAPSYQPAPTRQPDQPAAQHYPGFAPGYAPEPGHGEPARPSGLQNAATAVLFALLCLLVGVGAFLITRAV